MLLAMGDEIALLILQGPTELVVAQGTIRKIALGVGCYGGAESRRRSRANPPHFEFRGSVQLLPGLVGGFALSVLVDDAVFHITLILARPQVARRLVGLIAPFYG